MQEKVLNYTKSHLMGISTAIIVLVAIIIGYSWGVSGFRSNINNDTTNIEQSIDDQNTKDVAAEAGQTKGQIVKSGTSVNGSGSVSNSKSVIINSEKIRPIPKDTKPADRPLYYFY